MCNNTYIHTIVCLLFTPSSCPPSWLTPHKRHEEQRNTQCFASMERKGDGKEKKKDNYL